MFKPPTDHEMREMLSYVQAGGLPVVAAQAAGVDPRRFETWEEAAGREKCSKRVRDFVEKLQQAHGQAVLRAQITAFNEKPLDWLKSTQKEKGETTPRDDFPLNQFLPMILKILEPFPEARQALSKIIGEG